MSDLSTLRLEAGLTRAEAARLFGRSERTWRRWECTKAPAYVRTILELLSGRLELLGWPGWRIVNGELHAPDLKLGFRREDLYAAWWDRQRLRAAQQRLQALQHDTQAAIGHDEPFVQQQMGGRR